MEKLYNVESENKSYWIGLDVVRIIAIFLVILVHSTSFYGFNKDNLNTFTYIIIAFFRYISFACVPLFLLLSGYLCIYKKPTLKYYIKIIKIIIEFLFCALLVALFNWIVLGNQYTFGYLITEMFRFNFPSYSWYIKMYIGLFLLIPFLNCILNSLSKKQAIGFIVVLILIFSQPFVTSYWQIAYPIMYYFIGGFFRKWPININKIVAVIVLFVTCLIQVLFYEFPFPYRYSVENHNNIGCLIISVMIFTLFYSHKICLSSKGKIVLSKMTRTIANASMSTFLISQIFESLTYRLFNNLKITSFAGKLPYLIYLTPLKFVLSLACGIVINLLSVLMYKLLIKAINKIILRFNKEKNSEQG